MMINPDKILEILLIEDNEDDAERIEKSLDPERYHITNVWNGKNAVDLLADRDHDVVLLDKALPYKNGLEILKETKDNRKDYAFIFLTIDNTVEIAVEAMKLGALDFLLKSSGFVSLPEMIEKVYETHQNKLELKRVEEALLESEEKFRYLVKNSNDIFVIIDKNGKEIFVSDSVVRITGFSVAETMGHLGFEFLHPDDVDHMSKALSKLLETSGGTIREEYRHRRKNGGWVYLEAIGTNYLHKPSVEGIILNIRDITERHRAEDAIKASEEKYRNLVENIDEGLAIVDENENFISVNRAITKIFGYSEKELLKMNLKDVTTPEEFKKIIEQTSIRKNGKSSKYEINIIRKDRSHGTVFVNVSPLFDNNKRFIGAYGIIRDITERKMAEEKIIHLNIVLRAVRNINQLITKEKDRDRLITRASNILVESRGFDSAWLVILDENQKPIVSAQAGLGDEFAVFIERMNNQIFNECCRRALKQSEVVVIGDPKSVYGDCPIVSANPGFSAFTIRLEHKGRILGLLSVEFSADLVLDEDEQGLFREVAGDIAFALHTIEMENERKRMEKEREKLQSQFIQAQKMESMGRLAGGVAHDFNNMLGVIIGYTEMAQDKVNPDQSLFADLQEIRMAADRSANLTRQLLAFARKQTVAPRVLDLNDTVEGMLKMLRRLIGEDIDLAWMPGTGLWPVKVDPSQIDQILANLCVNARDAIAGVGKMTIETGNTTLDESYCASHAGFVPGKYVLLSVSDSGCGMDEETSNKSFEPFFTTKKMGKGTGLGLSTVYGIVKQNNG
ncbi:PAS domain S-box protein, partial [bacterium]|nr:PAS domain S-box protein [bacterium]